MDAKKLEALRQMGSMIRRLAPLAAFYLASATLAAQGLRAGGLSEFNVELPRELRQLAGRGQLSPVTHALVTVAVPAKFSAAHNWPVMIISATSDPHYNSSRRLLAAYSETALADGFILLAADPAGDVSVEQDEVALRYALDSAALAALELQWPGAAKAPLAFGGFSGGAKYSGWLAAAFASQKRVIMGIYLAGINQDTIVSAAREFNVLDEAYKGIPIFLQSGLSDEIATPADHRRVQSDLLHAGFRHVRAGVFSRAACGRHAAAAHGTRLVSRTRRAAHRVQVNSVRLSPRLRTRGLDLARHFQEAPLERRADQYRARPVASRGIKRAPAQAAVSPWRFPGTRFAAADSGGNLLRSELPQLARLVTKRREGAHRKIANTRARHRLSDATRLCNAPFQPRKSIPLPAHPPTVGTQP